MGDIVLFIKSKIQVIVTYVLISFAFNFCSVDIQTIEQDSTTPSTTNELTFCEKIEIEYVGYSNNLFDNTKDFNLYLDEISPDSIDIDRKTFFDEIDINYKYREVYISYLEVRLDNLTNIYNLLTENIECYFPDDQSIALEQITKAQEELNLFLDQ